MKAEFNGVRLAMLAGLVLALATCGGRTDAQVPIRLRRARRARSQHRAQLRWGAIFRPRRTTKQPSADGHQ